MDVWVLRDLAPKFLTLPREPLFHLKSKRLHLRPRRRLRTWEELSEFFVSGLEMLQDGAKSRKLFQSLTFP